MQKINRGFEVRAVVNVTPGFAVCFRLGHNRKTPRKKRFIVCYAII